MKKVKSFDKNNNLLLSIRLSYIKIGKDEIEGEDLLWLKSSISALC